MRIGVVGPTGREEVAENIAYALSRGGHEVTQLGPAHPRHRDSRVRTVAMLTRMAMHRVDERSQRRIARSALEAECEVVINVDLRLSPSVVRQLSRNGVKIAFWFPDPVSHLMRQLMVLAPYDALFFKEPHIVNLLKANLGLPAFYLPEACNPRWH